MGEPIDDSIPEVETKKAKGNTEDIAHNILTKANFFLTLSRLTDALPLFTEVLNIEKENIQALIGKAVCLQGLGLSQDALLCYNNVLSIDKDNIKALLQSGILYQESERINEALSSFNRVLEIQPENETAQLYSAQLLTDVGTRLKMLGNLDLAIENYLRAIKLNNTYSPAYYNIGVLYSEMGKYDEALECYNMAVKHNPLYVEAYCNIGVIHKTFQRLEQAIIYYKKALQVNPNFQIAKNNLSIALTDMGTKLKNEGNLQEGIKHYKQALYYNSRYPDVYYNLGVAYGEKLKYERAITHYELAIHFNPMCCEAYNNLGVIYKDMGNLEKAMQSYEAALMINPKFATTLNNIGVVYTVQGKMEEAFASLKSAIVENPFYGEAYNNLGVLYRDEGLMKEAIEAYEKCIQLNPLSRNASQNKLLAINYISDYPLEDLYKNHVQWGQQFQRQFKIMENENQTELEISSHPLRIGYISPDFFTHSVSYFIEGILVNHNPEKCHVICYSNILKGDAKTMRFKELAHSWRDIHSLTTEQVASLIRSDKVDILVELTGHTAGNRLDVLALKPAKIQVTYIGYPNTTGLKTIDYRFTDEIADPPDSKQKYSEELVYLPKCFLCYTPPDAGDVVSLPCLTNGFITFGSFNGLVKINDNVIDIWASIMKLLPNSRFILKSKPFASASTRQRFLDRFSAKGIDSSRFTLLTLIPSCKTHLQTYQYMDLSLDTFPYAGTTTTCESLWMGVPVVTLKGNTHAHNVGCSLLTAVGQESLIAYSKEEYVKIAVDLAQDVSRLQHMRKTLRPSMKNSWLCNAPEFTKGLEQIYQDLWDKLLTKRMSKSPKE